MKPHKSQSYTLTFALLLSSLLFTLLGGYWNRNCYQEPDAFSVEKPTLALAMQGLHDGLWLQEQPFEAVQVQAAGTPSTSPSYLARIKKDREDSFAKLEAAKEEVESVYAVSVDNQQQQYPFASPKADSLESKSLTFTTATDDYFADAVFIGDSRTVGISEFSGIENATFLCKTSLTIYDYDKPKIQYNNKKTSIKEVLSQKKFAKIYIMLGINECGRGTPESFYELYHDVVMDIRRLQPQALIFIQANLLVTNEKSNAQNSSVTNENITARNDLIATLANNTNIFYIDVNESSLCENGALIAQYTWDQIHIKAQYYQVWKDFLLEHAIVTS